MRAAARSGLTALAVTATLGASCCDCVDDPHNITPASAAIIPGDVAVLMDQPFQMEVRLWDSQGHALSTDPANPPAWQSSDNSQLQGLVTSGRLAQFSGLATGTFTVTVVADGQTATAQVVVRAPAMSGADDRLNAPYVQPPVNFALVSGSRGGGAILHEMHAFAGATIVANMTENLPSMVLPDGTKMPARPGSVVLFSRQYETGLSDASWQKAPPDVVDFHESGMGTGTINPQLQPEITIPVRVWNASNSDAVDLDELNLANRSLAASRAGIVFDEVDDVIGLLQPISVTVSDCLDPKAVLRLKTDATVSPWDPAKPELHIVYVDGAAGARGIGCNMPVDAPPARLVFLDVSLRSSSTLAHELGHIFSLLRPNSGHVESSAGFDQSNLMWTGLDDTHTARRDLFSLGQTFRLVMDDWSWLNLGGFRAGTTYRCHEQDVIPGEPAGQCPRLSHPWINP